MATLEFYNNSVELNDLFYESHCTLLSRVCMELGHVDKMEELKEKFLGDKHVPKKRKDPNLPKRAKTAYLYFASENRVKVTNKLKKSKKDSSMPAVSKELGKLWKLLKDKKKYELMSKKDKTRYENEMSAYKDENA